MLDLTIKKNDREIIGESFVYALHGFYTVGSGNLHRH